ncbi:hypothetical protein [Nocardioides panzhihuensis]|uniref:Uncharacterized protein n=1 Tax=Nocardioides panzhihuensis TaxID=860243 RepID=A0A7Z0IQ41_9ACTN|nr:hypothetical protein [Nocardioides panzhihuensis]NYI75426.1 hypothetical protein [Nocardioides panzhihuensis]
MTYAAPAPPPPAPQRSSGPGRWAWFAVGITGGLVLGVIGAGIFVIVGAAGSDDERPNVAALAGENYCYRIAERLGMDYVGDDLSGDTFGLDYGGSCTLTEANPDSDEYGHSREASFEIELRNLNPLIDWVRDCHDGQRAGGVVTLPGEQLPGGGVMDERTCVSVKPGSGTAWAGRMLADSLSITVDPDRSEHPRLDVRLVEILDAAESELS